MSRTPEFLTGSDNLVDNSWMIGPWKSSVKTCIMVSLGNSMIHSNSWKGLGDSHIMFALIWVVFVNIFADAESFHVFPAFSNVISVFWRSKRK